jgi:hypothetical protein
MLSIDETLLNKRLTGFVRTAPKIVGDSLTPQVGIE